MAGKHIPLEFKATALPTEIATPAVIVKRIPCTEGLEPKVDGISIELPELKLPVPPPLTADPVKDKFPVTATLPLKEIDIFLSL
jgi:hypothetical protein